MSKRKFPKRTETQLLNDLKTLMEKKSYIMVDDMLKQNPKLIQGLTPCCEVPLVMAIKQWDSELVEICINHGANPTERHECSKDSKPKIPILIAAEELSKRIMANRDSVVVEGNIAVYEAFIRVMQKKASFSKGAP